MQIKNRGKYILVLSGSKDFRLFSARALNLGGYNVEVARNAREASSIVRDVEGSGGNFDLIVTEMEGSALGFHDDLSELYKKNIFIPTLPMYNWGMESFKRDDNKEGVKGEVCGTYMGNNLMSQVRTVIG